MRAVRIHEHGGFDVLSHEKIEVPLPKVGEVQIKVAWCALNHLDTWVRRGVPGHKFPLPITPGCDFSGHISQLGEGVEGLEVGQAVCVNPGFSCGECRHCQAGNESLCKGYGIYGETTDGGNAEFAVVNARNVLPVPGHIGLDVAAAFPLTYLTAWHMVVVRCRIKAGDRVLIHAAGSGVSVAATQIAKHFGAQVMVTAGSQPKLDLAAANGADFGVNYREGDWRKAAKEWVGGANFDIIVDHVGVDTLPSGVWLLAKGGRLVTCGVTSGAEMKLNLAPIFFKSLSILGSTMGDIQDFHEVAKLIWQGELCPVLTRNSL